MTSSGAKIMSLDEALGWCGGAPRPLAFTNGVFDLLHAGHVHALEASRREGASLAVGVNTDRSVRSLGKGEDRPLVAERDRATVVAALECVDAVILFDEPTPVKLIEALRPDVLIKGGDYSRETVVGADLVERWGGKIVIVPIMPNRSTTRLVERIRGKI